MAHHIENLSKVYKDCIQVLDLLSKLLLDLPRHEDKFCGTSVCSNTTLTFRQVSSTSDDMSLFNRILVKILPAIDSTVMPL